ncbi:MAG: hypothetical protein ACRC2T_18175, partial [Thermoguttaceae bacterium]
PQQNAAAQGGIQGNFAPLQNDTGQGSQNANQFSQNGSTSYNNNTAGGMRTPYNANVPIVAAAPSEFVENPYVNQVAYNSNGSNANYPVKHSTNSSTNNPGNYPNYHGNSNSGGSGVVNYGLNQQSAEWESLTRAAMEALKTRINLAPTREAAVADELKLRLLELTINEQNLGLCPVPTLDESAQNFVSNELYGLATLLDERTSPDFGVRSIMAQPHFQEAALNLQKACPIQIRNAIFVKSWTSYGIYEPANAEFQPDDLAWLYMELENATVNGNETTGFYSKVRISSEILDSSGKRIDKWDGASSEITSKTRRRDHAVDVKIRISPKLAPGQYFLVINVMDENNMRLPTDSQRLPFFVRTRNPSQTSK